MDGITDRERSLSEREKKKKKKKKTGRNCRLPAMTDRSST